MGQGFGYTGADSASFVKTAGWPANWSGPNLLWKRSPPIHVYRSIGDDKQSFLGELRVYNPRLRSFQTRTVFPPNQGLWKPKPFFTTFHASMLKVFVLRFFEVGGPLGGPWTARGWCHGWFLQRATRGCGQGPPGAPLGEMEFFGWTGIWFIHIYIT